MDLPALNESEAQAREKLVALCRQMLAGELSFFEGAIQICSLQPSVRVPNDDPDLMAFLLIQSETDHLPPRHVEPHWSHEALRKIQPEFERTEIWAKGFAIKACQNIIARFSAQ